MSKDFNKKLGLRIRELRLSKNMKQRDIADKLDMEHSNFTRIESGKQRPNDENLVKIAKILEVDVKELFEFDHILSDNDLKNQIIKKIDKLSSTELKFIYKTLDNLSLLNK